MINSDYPPAELERLRRDAVLSHEAPRADEAKIAAVVRSYVQMGRHSQEWRAEHAPIKAAPVEVEQPTLIEVQPDPAAVRLWSLIANEMIGQVQPDTYRVYIQAAKAIDFVDGRLRLEAPHDRLPILRFCIRSFERIASGLQGEPIKVQLVGRDE